MKGLLGAAVGVALLPLFGDAASAGEGLMSKLVVSAPSAVSVIVMAYLGIDYLKGDRKARQTERESTEAFFKTLHLEHIDARTESRRAIEANTDALRTNAQVTQRNNDLLDNLSRSNSLRRS